MKDTQVDESGSFINSYSTTFRLENIEGTVSIYFNNIAICVVPNSFPMDQLPERINSLHGFFSPEFN